MDLRTRILNAAVERLRVAGAAGFTITAVAQLAGVSRPSVYATFRSRDALESEALKLATAQALERITASAASCTDAADQLVEMIIAGRTEFRSSAALASIAFPRPGGVVVSGDVAAGGSAVGPQAIAITRSYLAPLLARHDVPDDALGEIAELTLRTLLSVVMLESEMSSSDDALRAFLHRRYVPALGLR